MKKITKQIPKQKLINDGFVEETFFITSDGKEFNSEIEANKHENILKFDSYFIKKYNYSICELDEDYHTIYIHNDKHLKHFHPLLPTNRNNTSIREELRKDLKQFFGDYDGSRIDIDRLKKGWNLIHIDDCCGNTLVSIYYPNILIELYNNNIKWNQIYIKNISKLKTTSN